MLIFPLFAVLVWYGCYRFRRQLQGLAVLVLGVGGVLMLAWLDLTLARLFGSSFGPSLFMLLLGGEAAIICVVGVFLIVQPRERAEVPCRKCGYELLGLEEENPMCPECGLAHAAAPVPKPERIEPVVDEPQAPLAGVIPAAA